jgi:hypothetical protein
MGDQKKKKKNTLAEYSVAGRETRNSLHCGTTMLFNCEEAHLSTIAQVFVRFSLLSSAFCLASAKTSHCGDFIHVSKGERR